MALKKRKALLLDDYHLLSYEELDSTNAEAKRLAEGGASHGAFIWALRQTDGRGRKGRSWISDEGNLFTSVLLSPEAPLDSLPQLSFVAANAALDSIAPLLSDSVELRCKWPNDILIGRNKLAGILLESFETFEADDSSKRWVTVGVGVNIDNCPNDPEIKAVCLKDAGVELVSAKIILSRFIHHFIHWYGVWQDGGFTKVRKHWLNYCEGVGQNISVELPGESVSGIFSSIDARGNLQLRLPDDTVRPITAGDVHLL